MASPNCSSSVASSSAAVRFGCWMRAMVVESGALARERMQQRGLAHAGLAEQANDALAAGGGGVQRRVGIAGDIVEVEEIGIGAEPERQSCQA